MDVLVLSLDPGDRKGLQALIDAGAADGDIQTIAAQLLREALAHRLSTADADAGRGTISDTNKDTAHGHALFRWWSNDHIKLPVLTALSLGAIVLLLGGYAKKWSWTGFAGNDQLWDWLHLLLLPIAIATFPLWLMYADHMSRMRRALLSLSVVIFAGFVAIGYLVPLNWTGFQGNTLWDWLTLIVLPLAIVTARSWPTSKREFRMIHIVLFGGLLLGWLVTVIGGYVGDWNWTGYPGNTLWDWMSLLLGPIAFTTILIPGAVRWLSGDVARQVAAEEERAKETPAVRPPSAVTPKSSPGGWPPAGRGRRGS